MDYGTMTAVAFGVVTLVLLAWLVLQRRPGRCGRGAGGAGAGGGSGAKVAVAGCGSNCIAPAVPDNDAKLDLRLACWRRSFRRWSLNSWWPPSGRCLLVEARVVPGDAA